MFFYEKYYTRTSLPCPRIHMDALYLLIKKFTGTRTQMIGDSIGAIYTDITMTKCINRGTRYSG